MWLLPVSLVLVSAALHAGWNLIVKGESDKLIGAWGTVVTAPVILSPFLLIVGLPPREAWPILGISGATHAAYMIALARAYEHGQLSVVYPVARGTAPLLVTAAAILVLGEGWSPLSVVSIAVAGGGVIWLGLPARPTSDHGATGLGWALITACLIALYTTVDKVGVARSHPVSYATGLWGVDAVCLTLYVLVRRHPDKIRAVWRTRWRMLVTSGVFSAGAYLLVLIAMRMMPVSYIAALRESSVVFGALLGWRVLGEAFGPQRIMASATVAAGLILLSLTAGS